MAFANLAEIVGMKPANKANAAKVFIDGRMLYFYRAKRCTSNFLYRERG